MGWPTGNSWKNADGYPAEERQTIIERFVDEEVLYRYALRLGLQQQPVAQRRLAKIAAFVATNPHESKPEAILAQEALDIGLHHGDAVVRRILIDGAQRLIRAVVLVRQPSEAMLQAYLNDNQEAFLTPQQTRITHVAVNRLKHGAQTEAYARSLRERIRTGAYTPQQATALATALCAVYAAGPPRQGPDSQIRLPLRAGTHNGS
ncbi:MAG: hypothetical protein R3F37_16825 [Candidatus Competibacteraceae bacterium]